jgi:hypothetical protein
MILQKKTFRTEKGICKVELVKKGAEYIVKVDGDIYKKNRK